jgi:hypothetical protein
MLIVIIMLGVAMLSVFKLNVVMLRVTAPRKVIDRFFWNLIPPITLTVNHILAFSVFTFLSVSFHFTLYTFLKIYCFKKHYKCCRL